MKIHKLEPRDAVEVSSAEAALERGTRAFQQASRLIASSLDEAFGELESKLDLVGATIASISDPAVAQGLAAEHAELLALIGEARLRLSGSTATKPKGTGR